jgi:outer membrane protein assembly factor BamB
MKKTTFLKCLCGIALILLANLLAAVAQEWSQWRGPQRDGVVPAFKPPAKWPTELKRRWCVEIGAGYSSPVVWQGQIFIHERQQENEIVSRLDLKTGRTIWRETYRSPSGKSKQYADSEGEGPYSTPIVDAGQLYTFGINAVFSCYDTKTGELKWRRDYSKELLTKERFCGTAMSPLVEGNLIIIYVGDDNRGRLVALDKETGREQWRWEESGAGYASPIAAEFDGVRQLIHSTDQSVVGLTFDTGKLLWKISYPSSRSGCSQNIVTPVVADGKLIITGQGEGKGITAIKPVRSEAGWQVERVWHNANLSMRLSSPTTDGKYLYGLADQRKGQYFRLDARNGELVWASNGREGEIASALLAGAYLLFLSDEGQLTIALRDTTRFEPLVRYNLARSKVWAHPAVLGGQILVRETSALTLWDFE